MPGRGQREAYNNYADRLQRVLAFITNVRLKSENLPKDSASSAQFVFVINPAPLPGSNLSFFFRECYSFTESGQRDWRFVMDSYEYAIEDQSQRKELFAYHWDPKGKGTVKIPHLHFGSLVTATESPINRKAHVPTGQVPIEYIVWFVIKELGVKSLRDNWQDLIGSSQ